MVFFLEVAALAATLNRPIFILHEMGQIYCFNQEGSEPDLFIWYSNLQGHYEALEVTTEAALAMKTKALPAKTSGGRQANRGGGKSPKTGSSKDRFATESQSFCASSIGGKTRCSSKSSLGGKTRKSLFQSSDKRSSAKGLRVTAQDSSKVLACSGRNTKSVVSIGRQTAVSRRSKAPSEKKSCLVLGHPGSFQSCFGWREDC